MCRPLRQVLPKNLEQDGKSHTEALRRSFKRLPTRLRRDHGTQRTAHGMCLLLCGFATSLNENSPQRCFACGRWCLVVISDLKFEI